MKLRSLKLSLGLLTAVAVGFGASVAYPKKNNPVAAPIVAAPISVEMEQAKWVDSWDALTHVSGMVKAKRKSDLSFERIGRIDRILVDKGDRVVEGQVLASLNTDLIEAQVRKLEAEKQAALAVLKEMKAGPRAEVLDAARATVRDFDAQLDLAKKNLERRRPLANTEALSKEDFEQAQSTVARMEAARTNAQKNLEDLQLGTRAEKILSQEATIASIQESIASAQVELQHSAIRSPYGGSVIERLVHEGAVATPGVTAFVISEVTQLEAHFGIPPQMIGSLSVGQQLDLIVRGNSIAATLKSIVPQVDDETRTLQVVAAVAQPDLSRVMAGDIAKLELTRPQKMEGIWLRTASVMQGQRGLWECFVVEKEPDSDTGIVKRRSIEILHTEGDRVLVRGAIHDGDWIVSSAVNRVVAGQKVTAMERGAE